MYDLNSNGYDLFVEILSKRLYTIIDNNYQLKGEESFYEQNIT